VPGQRGGAIELDGHGWLECPQPDLPAGAPPPAFSISLWIKRTRVRPSTNVALVSREIGTTREDFLFFGFDRYVLKATGRGWYGSTASSLPDSRGRWLHLAFTHAAGGTTRLYADGVEVARNQVRHRKMVGGRSPLLIGAGYLKGDRRVRRHVAGVIDELALFQRALSDEEVTALASGAQPVP
jgi:hypothetical protein